MTYHERIKSELERLVKVNDRLTILLNDTGFDHAAIANEIRENSATIIELSASVEGE